MPTDGSAGERPEPLRVVFILHSLTYLRFFESAFEELLARGHTVVLRLQDAPRHQYQLAWTRKMDDRTGFEWGMTKGLNKDPWRHVHKRVRRTVDYLRFLQPSYARTPFLVERAARRAPRGLVPLMAIPFTRSPLVLRPAVALLSALDNAIPSSRLVLKEIEKDQPDVVVLSPHLMPGSRDSEFVKACRTARIPCCLAVASWDNLSSKQQVHQIPDVLLVWNDTQRAEAINLHGVPSERIRITGAQNFDLWFDWPARPRKQFCEHVGLDVERPFVLYLGGSLFPSTRTEAAWARDWLTALRTSSDPVLSTAGVLFRPHPSRVEEWLDASLEEFENVVVWPRTVKQMPIAHDARADYFDSMHHSAAVVGLNTSAMIEAAIVGRPVHTLLVPEFASSQSGVFHFDYLLEAGGGMPVIARSLAEHTDQLAATLNGHGLDREQERLRFLGEFVRPHGLDRAATPIFVDAIEDTARVRAAPEQRRVSALPLRGVLEVLRAVAPEGTVRMASVAALNRGRRLGTRAPKQARHGRSRVRGKASRLLGRSTPADPGSSQRILFELPYSGYLRMYGSTLRTLAERGHHVLISYDTPDKRVDPEGARFAELEGIEIVPRFPWRPEGVRKMIERLRPTIDYLRYEDRRFGGTPHLQDRMRRYVPAESARLLRVPKRLAPALVRLLVRLDRLTPVDPRVRRHLRKQRADVVVVSPLIARGISGIRQTETIKAARKLGIPVALAVGSWDHLTSKGIIKALPDRVFVWNEAQRQEAVELHRVPRNRVVLTGAQLFDQWFDRAPSRKRVEFLAELGLDQAYVLYVGSSPNITEPVREEAFVREWIAALRAAGEPLGNLGILVRPHPGNIAHWAAVDLSPLNAVVMPRERPQIPMSGEDEDLYFDSIHHAAAVVGINTSAIIESLIQRRPVLTIRAEEFRETQEGTLHFHHLVREGGAVQSAATLDEHVAQLRAVLASPDAVREQIDAFLSSFVRPHGLDHPATPILADAIESLLELRR